LSKHGLLRCRKLSWVNLVVRDARPREQDWSSVAIDGLREIALALECCRSVELRRAAARNKLPVKFLTPENEKLVLYDWSANLISDVVVAVNCWIIVRRTSG